MAVDDVRDRDPAGGTAGRGGGNLLHPAATLVAGVRTVLDHRIILIAAVPLLLWHVLATALGFLPEPPVIATVVADTLGGRGGHDWWDELATAPERLLLVPLASGVALALALAAGRGRPLLLDAAQAAWQRFPALAGIAAAVWALAAIPALVPSAGRLRAALALVALYLLLRLWLAAPAALAEDLGASGALVRSWSLTRGAGWRVLLLGLLATAPTTAAAGLLPAWLTAAVGYGWQPVADTVAVTAFLRLAGTGRASAPAARPPAPPLGTPDRGSPPHGG